MIIFTGILILVLLLALAIAVVIIIYLLDSVFGGLDFATSPKARLFIGSIIKKQFNSQSAIFLDLGCARGDLALAIKRSCPELQVYGIDNSWVRLSYARAKAWLLGLKAGFLQGDLFNSNVSQTDVAYIYLDKQLLPKLEDKLYKEMKNGGIVITNTYGFAKWQPEQTYITNPEHPNFQKLFVYVKV